jgi:hypothetical protein
VVLEGADVRGAIYAVYTFSERYLGVPPLWRWMGWRPVTRPSISLPADGGVRFAAPQVRYRAWFLNNQDLWLGWTPPAGVDREQLLFETMLRLKLNTYDIGESFGEYGGGWLEKARAADDRGLVVAANNLATFRKWDAYWTEVRGYTAPPELSLANQHLFDDYWDYSVGFGVDHGFEVLWVLGFRGRSDGGFWNDMADAPTDPQARANVVEAQVGRQIALVRQRTGQPHPRMAFLLWNELTGLLDGGQLRLPEDDDVIWLFGNEVRDHFPGAGARTYPLPAGQPIGYYLNLQFYSTGAHLAEAEGLWKAHQNFDLIERRRPGARIGMGLLNVGNVREFLLTASATADLFWDVRGYLPDDAMDRLLAGLFGEAQAAELRSLYRRYLDAYWQQRGNTIAGFERQHLFQDLRIKEATDRQLDLIRARTRNLNPFNEERLRIDHAYHEAASDVGAIMLGGLAASENMQAAADVIGAHRINVPDHLKPFYDDMFLAPAGSRRRRTARCTPSHVPTSR